MMTSAFAIYLLMWMPALVRIVVSKNKMSEATEELSNDTRIVWVYLFGHGAVSLDSPGVENQKKPASPFLGLSLGVQKGPVSRMKTSPMSTPRGDFTPRFHMDHNDFIGGGFIVKEDPTVSVMPQDIADDIIVGNTALIQVNPIHLNEAEGEGEVEDTVEGSI